MFVDTKGLVGVGYVAARAALSEAWPDAAFEALEHSHDAKVRISWVDGPAVVEVRALLSPLLKITGTLVTAGAEVKIEQSMMELHRHVTPLANAYAVGLLILETGTPSLPDLEVYSRAGVDPGLPGPYGLGVINDLALHLPFNQEASPHAISSYAARAEKLLERTSLVSFSSLLSSVSSPAVECFGTLCRDLGLGDAEDVALYAASGGWDLAVRTVY